MSKSIMGTVLHVDLTESRLWEEHPDEAFYRKYGGGSAMGVYYLLKEMKPGTDPLSPGNILTIFTARSHRPGDIGSIPDHGERAFAADRCDRG